MSLRNLIITRHSKLTYSNNLLIVQNCDGCHKIPLEDLDLILLDSTQVMMSSRLLCECSKFGIKIIVTDYKYQPTAELVSYYSNQQSVMNINKQIMWKDDRKDLLWTKIVYEKIYNQSQVLNLCNIDAQKLIDELDKIEIGDITNREGKAAQKYFPLLFGKGFTRGYDNHINAALDYGYSILLSMVNKEIVNMGYLTQLGIHHKNQNNYFNLGSDLMEIFRPIVDLWVCKRKFNELTPDIKYGLVDLLNVEIIYSGQTMLLKNAMSKYVRNCIKFLNGECEEINIELEITNEVSNNEINGYV